MRNVKNSVWKLRQVSASCRYSGDNAILGGRHVVGD